VQAESIVRKLGERAGITVNGNRPYDIQVNDPRFYQRVLGEGTLGLGNSYMESWWDCADLSEFFYRVLKSGLRDQLRRNLRLIVGAAQARLFNLQSRRRAYEVGEKHYDWSNQLYQAMLDPYLTYSCGYWQTATDLASAQEDKLDLFCRKLKLEPGMTLLDIGCGWGSLLRFAAEHYQVEGVGLTVSTEQAKLTTELCLGLPVQIRLQDYRSVRGKFDRVGSIGMFEHVGYKNYREFMRVVARVLVPDGLFGLHSIGGNVSVHDGDPWLNTHIFPNSMLPSVAQIGGAAERLFVIEDWHNFGPYYYPTLQAWYDNLMAAWPELSKDDPERYSETNRRMWEYYLLSCAALFRVRATQLWQIVMSKEGGVADYQSVR
jgi:cyclopropane-fatty-acyl-phospholipid synthase